MSAYPISVPSKRLAASITSGATSFRVNNILGWDGVALTSADLGSVHYVVFRNAAGTLMEIMQIDSSTIASASITINLRGLDFEGNISEVSANKLSWLANETIVEFGSHPPQLFRQSYLDLFTAQTISAIKTFSVLPETTAGNPTSDNQFVRKAYADSILSGGSGIPNRLVVAGTAGETLAAGNLVYLKISDGRWWKCDADTASIVENVILGIAQGTGTAGNAVNSGVLMYGLDSNQSGLTANTKYYASNTAGGISTSAGTTEVSIGFALSTTTLLFTPQFDQILTEDLQDALAGTSGIPSASNLFLTADDAATAATASKLARRLAGGNITVVTESQANNSTNAASTAYVDTGLATLPTKDEVPHTKAAFGTYFTSVSPIDANLGWTIVGTQTRSGNWVAFDNVGNTRAFILLAGQASHYVNTLLWSNAVKVKISYMFTANVVSDGSGAFDASDTWFYHGFNHTSEAASIPALITGVSRRAGFAHYNGRIYTITGDGSGVTATDIQADSVAKRAFMIDVSSTSVKFYINGTLVATHTTNIASSANNIALYFGGSDNGGSNAGFGMSAAVTISESLS